jgi:hypothetical protein
MEVLGLSRMEAAWYTPAVVLVRMQMAHLENNGDGQRWSKSRLDIIAERIDNGE